MEFFSVYFSVLLTILCAKDYAISIEIPASEISTVNDANNNTCNSNGQCDTLKKLESTSSELKMPTSPTSMPLTSKESSTLLPTNEPTEQNISAVKSNVSEMNTTSKSTSSEITSTTSAPLTSIVSPTLLPTNESIQQNISVVTSNASEINTTVTEPTTIENSTTFIPEYQSSHYPTDGICFCDLTVNHCDINCCCDPECSSEDRLVFANCHRRRPYFVNPRYCYQTEFIYNNNTELKMVWLKDGLFCILEDNLPITVQYRNINGVTSLKEFNKLYNKQERYTWPTHSIRQPYFIPMKGYIHGSVIWTFKNGSLEPMALPVKVSNTLCRTSKNVEFLADFTSSCSQTIPSPNDCELARSINAASFYKNITFLTSPEFINQTQPNLIYEQCVNTSCIPLTTYLCSSHLNSSGYNTCMESSEIPLPVYVNTTNICHNVVQHVKYMFVHNGTQGIIQVFVYFTLANISLSTPYSQFSQHFNVEFTWTKSQNRHKRSGRPGYLIGKPIIAGRKILHVSKDENGIDKTAIELSSNSMDWLNIPAVKSDGMCDTVSKQPVTFGENRRSTCQLPLGKSNFKSVSSCALMQQSVLTLLVGNAIINITEAIQFNKYVATFGDSKVEDTGDWVQVLLNNVPIDVTGFTSSHNNRLLVCKSIITSIHLDVIFAYVGALANPQAKILGVSLTFGKPHDLTLSCYPKDCSDFVSKFQVLSTVSFIDVSEPPKVHFSELPVYEVKLAYDFFYPFHSGSIISTLNTFVLMSALIAHSCLLGFHI